jgi:hypothetical protein
VERVFPEECKVMKMFVDILPGDHFSPVHPFGGVVINFNVSTRIHRDGKDEKICLVLPVSDDDCVGGELVLYEPGVVLKLKSGDLAIFRSADISHFNLHYVGERASYVFNTDRMGRKWYQSRNGWIGHHFFKTSGVGR